MLVHAPPAHAAVPEAARAVMRCVHRVPNSQSRRRGTERTGQRKVRHEEEINRRPATESLRREERKAKYCTHLHATGSLPLLHLSSLGSRVSDRLAKGFELFGGLFDQFGTGGVVGDDAVSLQ